MGPGDDQVVWGHWEDWDWGNHTSVGMKKMAYGSGTQEADGAESVISG